jgi:hypothetical protein
VKGEKPDDITRFDGTCTFFPRFFNNDKPDISTLGFPSKIASSTGTKPVLRSRSRKKPHHFGGAEAVAAATISELDVQHTKIFKNFTNS